MKLNYFAYTEYCTAFYVPEMSAVMVYDEIKDREIQTIPAATAAKAETIIVQWQKAAPRGCICIDL